MCKSEYEWMNPDVETIIMGNKISKLKKKVEGWEWHLEGHQKDQDLKTNKVYNWNKMKQTKNT